MKRFEYKTVVWTSIMGADLLNMHGAHGYELVAVTVVVYAHSQDDFVYTFKRELP